MTKTLRRDGSGNEREDDIDFYVIVANANSRDKATMLLDARRVYLSRFPRREEMEECRYDNGLSTRSIFDLPSLSRMFDSC